MFAVVAAAGQGDFTQKCVLVHFFIFVIVVFEPNQPTRVGCPGTFRQELRETGSNRRAVADRLVVSSQRVVGCVVSREAREARKAIRC